MVTPSRPHRGRQLGLSIAERRLILGDRSRLLPGGAVHGASIVRHRHLVAHLSDPADWQRQLDELERLWGPYMRERARLRRRQRRAAAKSRTTGRQNSSAPRSKARATAG